MKIFLLVAIAIGGISCGSVQAKSPESSILEAKERKAFSGGKAFERWMVQRKKDLKEGSQIATTAAGPIEYKKRGSGPVVICLHGAFGGYDASYLMGEKLVAKGYTVIAVSRPGYLRTPLSVGSTPEQQADAMIALMDTLKIKKAAVIGFSAGTLTAFQMASRHPGRVWACVMQGVGALPDDFKPGGTYDVLRAVVKQKELEGLFDVITWGLYEFARSDVRDTAEFILRDDVLDAMPKAELKERIRFVKSNAEQSAFLRSSSTA